MSDTVNAVELLSRHTGSDRCEVASDLCIELRGLYERGAELVISTCKDRTQDSLIVSNWTSSCSSKNNTPPNGKKAAEHFKQQEEQQHEENGICQLCLA